jgi:nitrogen fixation/metabolism regulation signal transduction histidine kinase
MTSPTAGAMTAPQAGPPKRKLRNYLLNPRFQLKYTSYIVATAVVLMIGLGVVIMRTANTAAAQATTASAQAERAMRESQTSSRIMRMNDLMNAADNPDLVHTIEAQLAEGDRQAARNLESVRQQRAQIEETRKLTIVTLLVTGILLVLLLGATGIVVTHKVVGPVFKMKRLLRLVGTGKLDIREKLRKGDELEDLFEVFIAMVESLKNAQRAELAKLEAALADAEAAGATTAVEKIRALRTEMLAALGTPDGQ